MGTYPLIWVAAPTLDLAEGPIDAPTLAAHRCTVFPMPAFRDEWRFRARSADTDDATQRVSVRPGTVVSSALSLRSVVLGGGGPALLADWLIADDIASGRLVDVLPRYEATATDFESAAWLMYPTRAWLPQRVRVVIDFLKARLPAHDAPIAV